MLSILPETWCLKVSRVFYEGWAKVSWPSDRVNTEPWNEHFFENRDWDLLHLDIFSDHTQNEWTKFKFDRKLSCVWTLLRALTLYIHVHLVILVMYVYNNLRDKISSFTGYLANFFQSVVSLLMNGIFQGFLLHQLRQSQ